MKRMVWFIIVIGCVGFLSSCDSDIEGSSGEKDKITLWYWNLGLDEEVLEKVEEEFTDVVFEAEKLPPGDDYKTKLQSLLASNSDDEAPDLVLMNIWASEFLPHADQFINLYEYGGEEIEENYPEWKVQQAVTGDGEKMIAIPVDTAPLGFFYREDIFKEAGIADSPEELSEKIDTWDGYVDVLTQLRDEADAYAIGSMEEAFDTYVNKLSERYFDENEEFIGHKEHIKEVWDRVISLYENDLILGNIEEQGQEWNAAINNNEIVGYDGAVWSAEIIEEVAPETSGKWRVAKSPVADGNDGGSFLGVLNSTDHPEISVKIAKFINSAENQIKSYKNLNLFPAHNEALESDDINDEKEFFGGQNITEVFAESAQNVKEAHRGSQETIVLSAFRDELDLIATQDKDPEEAWEDALKKIERDLSL